MSVNIKNKFELFVDVRGGDRKIDFCTTNFNDGSIKVQIPTINKESLERFFKVKCYMTSLDDLSIIGQIVDIIKRNTRQFGVEVCLELLSPMYSRYDRVMHETRTDGFGLLVFANMIKATGIDRIVLIDPHSDVTERVLKLAVPNVEVVHQKTCLFETMYNGDSFAPIKMMHDFIVVVPDEGAVSKCADYTWTLRCIKDRDSKTGRIRGVKINTQFRELSDFKNAKESLLIVDDICERGGTFLGVVKAIRDGGCSLPINLYVTHGIFPEDTDFETLARTFDNIYVHSMSESAHNRCVEGIFNVGGSFFCKNIYKGC